MSISGINGSNSPTQEIQNNGVSGNSFVSQRTPNFLNIEKTHGTSLSILTSVQNRAVFGNETPSIFTALKTFFSKLFGRNIAQDSSDKWDGVQAKLNNDLEIQVGLSKLMEDYMTVPLEDLSSKELYQFQQNIEKELKTVDSAMQQFPDYRGTLENFKDDLGNLLDSVISKKQEQKEQEIIQSFLNPAKREEILQDYLAIPFNELPFKELHQLRQNVEKDLALVKGAMEQYPEQIGAEFKENLEAISVEAKAQAEMVIMQTNLKSLENINKLVSGRAYKNETEGDKVLEAIRKTTESIKKLTKSKNFAGTMSKEALNQLSDGLHRTAINFMKASKDSPEQASVFKNFAKDMERLSRSLNGTSGSQS